MWRSSSTYESVNDFEYFLPHYPCYLWFSDQRIPQPNTPPPHTHTNTCSFQHYVYTNRMLSESTQGSKQETINCPKWHPIQTFSDTLWYIYGTWLRKVTLPILTRYKWGVSVLKSTSGRKNGACEKPKGNTQREAPKHTF